MRSAIPLVLLALLATACGAGGGTTTFDPSTTTATASAPAPAGSLAAILGVVPQGRDLQTEDLLVTSGREFTTGPDQRIGLALLAKDGSVLKPDTGTIDVYVAPDALSKPLGPFTATYAPLGVDTTGSPLAGVYTVHVTVPKAGSYFIGATFSKDGTRHAAIGSIGVNDSTPIVAVGAPVPASDTPTLTTTHGDTKPLTTANPPDLTLLKYSIADSLKAHRPFVAVFATPLFCQSRLCGPTVEVVQAVQKRLAGTPMRFIHVEIYTDNDASKPENRWVGEWKLQSEPWIFVVGADGKLRAKFEGAVGVDEVEAAARAALR
jgi:hypothetical protein